MSRQIFSVLVGLLREEKSFLDFHSWMPARYQWWQHGRVTRDNLDLLSNPLNCTSGTCSNVYQMRDRGLRFVHAERAIPKADIDVSWIPMPIWSSVSDALVVAAAQERAAARDFDLILVFVPSAWQLDTGDSGLQAGVYDRAPTAFWETWSAWQLEHPEQRLAALTMPLERIKDCVGTQQNSNRLFIKRYNLTVSEQERICRPQGCCLGAVVAARNQLIGLPAGWERIDFAALTRASLPTTVADNNWHYECSITQKYVQQNNCAHRPHVRMGAPTQKCSEEFKKWFQRAQTVTWVSRDSGDCGEEGNTLLWTHLLRESKWLR